MRVLIVEDEKNLAMALEELLRCEGFQTDITYNGVDGLDNALSRIYDLIILDIMLPKMNGMDVLRELRKNGVTSSVLMLTAKSQMQDKVHGLRSGADDYLTKPFDTEEFLARVWALARRKSLDYIPEMVHIGDISLNRTTHVLSKENNKIKLSTREFEILELLILNRNMVLTKEQFVQKIWGYDTDIEYNSIEVYISFLRKKLEALGSELSIETMRGVGYTIKET